MFVSRDEKIRDEFFVGCLYLDVSHSVVIQVGRSRETLAADGALVRLLAAVDAPVSVQRAGRRETLAAHVANVRLFTCKEISTTNNDTQQI